MSLHILCTDPSINTDLSGLLNELDEEAYFYEDLNTLKSFLPALSKKDAVFYHFKLENEIWAYASLYMGCRKTHLVLFESLTNESAAESLEGRGTGEEYLLLPQNNRARAKSRIKETLRNLRKKTELTKGKPEKKQPEAAAQKAPKITRKNQTPKGNPQKVKETPGTRYLHAHSEVMLLFEECLRAAAGQDKILILEGEDGAEFELVAREINFISNGDDTPLIMIDLSQLTFDELEIDPKATGTTKKPRYCYTGLSCDLNSMSAEHLLTLIHILEDSKEIDSEIFLIVGHVHGSESYISANVQTILQDLRQKARCLHIPNLAQRKEDIPFIANSIFSTLRIAHPFVSTRTLSKGAIKFLEDNIETLDYCSLARVMRNTMALAQNSILTEDQLKSFSDNSQTTRHLIESMADENYFKENIENQNTSSFGMV